jgi:transposase InsO family protein
MSGEWLTQKQVDIYMNCRKLGKTQEVSAAKAGISERSGRDIEKGKWQDPKKKQRHWRTRPDPLSDVWEDELLPLLRSEPSIQPMTLLELIQANHGLERYPDSLLRTLQRRVKDWHHLHGSGCEVIFNQCHQPGQQGISDFTEFTDIVITIKGKFFSHKLYHFRLTYSGWSYMQVVQGGESYAALSDGLQNALWLLGGSPKEHRTDSLAAAFKNLSKSAQDDQTQMYADLCKHLNMKATRNNRGVSHENGAIESPHGYLKRRIKQALLLRKSDDFNSIEAYQSWLNSVVDKHNKRNAKKITEELPALQALPSLKAANYRVYSAKVSRASTIKVTTSLYSVPSKFIGSYLQIHQYDSKLDCYYGSQFVMSLPRVFGSKGKRRAKHIDYRHVIDSLLRKPGAFYNYQHREALLPNDIYRSIWLTLDKKLLPIDASKYMIGLLYLSAKQNCEQKLGQYVLSAFNCGELPELKALQKQFGLSMEKQTPVITVQQHPLSQYNALISTKMLEGLSHESC